MANYTFKVLRFLFEFGEPPFNNADEVTSAKVDLCSAMLHTHLGPCDNNGQFTTYFLVSRVYFKDAYAIVCCAFLQLLLE